MGKKLMQIQTSAITDEIHKELSLCLFECSAIAENETKTPLDLRDNEFTMRSYENKVRADMFVQALDLVKLALEDNTASVKIKPSGDYKKTVLQNQSRAVVDSILSRLDNLIKVRNSKQNNGPVEELFIRTDKAAVEALIEAKHIVNRVVNEMTI